MKPATGLTSIPNIGPRMAAELRRLGIEAPEDLRGHSGQELYDRLCLLDGRRHDPCVLDTFEAAVAFAQGGPPRPWWEFSRERKAGQAATGQPPATGWTG